MPGQGIVDIGMVGDRLPFVGGGVAVDVMPGTVAVENASSRCQFPNQFSTPHRAISFT
jgi:hypothetical protein